MHGCEYSELIHSHEVMGWWPFLGNRDGKLTTQGTNVTGTWVLFVLHSVRLQSIFKTFWINSQLTSPEIRISGPFKNQAICQHWACISHPCYTGWNRVAGALLDQACPLPVAAKPSVLLSPWLCPTFQQMQVFESKTPSPRPLCPFEHHPANQPLSCSGVSEEHWLWSYSHALLGWLPSRGAYPGLGMGFSGIKETVMRMSVFWARLWRAACLTTRNVQECGHQPRWVQIFLPERKPD